MFSFLAAFFSSIGGLLILLVLLIVLFHFIALLVLLGRTHRIDKNTEVLYDQNQLLWKELQDLKAMINHKQN